MRHVRMTGLVLPALLAALAWAAEEPAPVSPVEVLTQAKAALASAGTIRAEIILDVTYPSPYTSEIEIFASPTGDEKAEIETKVNDNRYRSREVISHGVLWNEQETPAGMVVSKIDISAVKDALREKNTSFAALPILGTNLLFDLDNLTRVVRFDSAREAELDGRRVYRVSGILSPTMEKDDKALPLGARRFYSRARIYLDAETSLPKRIELGGTQDGKPVLSLDFVTIETKVEPPEGTFIYSPPEGAEVIDRTEWAVAQMLGE